MSGEEDRPSTAGDGLERLLESLHGPDPTSEGMRESTPGTALVVSCSMSEGERGGRMWPVEPSWNVVDVTTLGNQTWERYDGERVLDGDLAHLTSEYDVTAVLVVGHTTCEVVGDAHERSVVPPTDAPAGIVARLSPLVSLVEDAFEAGILDGSTSLQTARHRLVEYNVVRQVAFLRGRLPDSTRTVGYVHDGAGAYGTFPDRRYLVTLDGETDPAAIRARLPGDASVRVASLLS